MMALQEIERDQQSELLPENEGKVNEIVQLAQTGNQDAVNFLFERCRRLILFLTRGYFLPGAEKEDLFQEGRIGFWKAITGFKEEKDTTFFNFAWMCIQRQITTSVITANREKHKMLSNSLSLDKSIFPHDDKRELLRDMIPCKKQGPEEQVIEGEKEEGLLAQISSQLSELEHECIMLWIEGYPYKEIGEKLGCSPKSVDNSLHRARRKLEKWI